MAATNEVEELKKRLETIEGIAQRTMRTALMIEAIASRSDVSFVDRQQFFKLAGELIQADWDIRDYVMKYLQKK